MNAYIIKFLKEINTLIIPNFGALTITDAASGEILFLPYLKYDDGKLVNFIAEQKGISTDEAKELIAESILGIQKKLELGENYPIESLGSFSKSKTGEIEFISEHFQRTPVSETDEATNAFAPSALKSEPQKSTPEIENQEQIISDEPAIIPIESEQEAIVPELELESEVIDLAENSIEIAEESIALETPENEILEEKIVLSDEIEVNDAPIYSEEDQWKDDLDLPPLHAKIERPKKPILEKTRKDKKPKRPIFYLLLLFAVLMIGGVLTISLFYNSFEKLYISLSKTPTEEIKAENIPKKNERENLKVIKQKEEGTRKASESTKEEAIQETPISEKPEVFGDSELIQTSTGQVNRTKPYHVIGGAFMAKSNAERYQNKLISAGNNSVIVGKFDQLYIVSIGSYPSKEEAEFALSTSRSISANVWIFQWP
jgi:cell division septation protein DedD